jgi:hypothetical protein
MQFWGWFRRNYAIFSPFTRRDFAKNARDFAKNAGENAKKRGEFLPYSSFRIGNGN